MKILMVSGSARTDSSNNRFLESLTVLFPEHEFNIFQELKNLPLFHADLQNGKLTSTVLNWKNVLKNSDALIICTPEYIYNIPALLKNALEWLTASGELSHKKVLPITFTPHAPRGEKTMQSLIWSLQALDANIVTQLALFQNEVYEETSNVLKEDIREVLGLSIGLLE